MPIVSECTYPGCRVRTIGSLCIDHDVPVERTFARGRAYHPPARSSASAAPERSGGTLRAAAAAVTAGSALRR